MAYNQLSGGFPALGDIYSSAGQSPLFSNMYGGEPGLSAPSTANYGPTDQGMNGLSPGRSQGMSALGTLAGFGIPGAGFIGGIGQGFNAGVQSAQLGDMAAQMQGQAPTTGVQQAGAFARGALGIGMSNEAFGLNAIGLGFSPDDAQRAVDNYSATGDINSASRSQAQSTANQPGYGIAGVAGPTATGINGDVSVNEDSATAFGQQAPNGMSMGNDGVVGTDPAAPSADFGDVTGAGETSGQGGSGSNGAAGGSSGDTGGGPSGGGGGGGDANGYAEGGLVNGVPHDHPSNVSGLVPGRGEGRADSVSAWVPVGSYVLPSDVVAAIGQGNSMAGATRLKGMMRTTGDVPAQRQTTQVKLSSGEFVVDAAHVAALGGAGALDRLVHMARLQSAQNVAAVPR